MAIDWDGLVIGPCMQAFGDDTVIWTSAEPGAQPLTITAIFDNGFRALMVEGGDGGMAPDHITASTPILGVQLSQFPTPPMQGDTVTVGGQVYQVNEVQPDGKGGAHLQLIEVDG